MIVINPGSGPCAGATLDHAYENMRVLLEDAKLTGATFARDSDAKEEGGRFSFLVDIPEYCGEHGSIPVDMPGLPLDRVRYSGKLPTPIPPRLYVDGSSWWWPFAVSILRDWVKEHEQSERDRLAELAAIRREREEAEEDESQMPSPEGEKR